MTKKNVMITVDNYIHSQAKDKGFNISEVCEKAIIKKLSPENEIDRVGSKCEYCGLVLRQATANDMNGLMWFLPDEKWICPKCEFEFTRKIIDQLEGDKKIVSTMSDEKRKEITQLAKDYINAFKDEILEQIKRQEPFIS